MKSDTSFYPAFYCRDKSTLGRDNCGEGASIFPRAFWLHVHTKA